MLDLDQDGIFQNLVEDCIEGVMTEARNNHSMKYTELLVYLSNEQLLYHKYK